MVLVRLLRVILRRARQAWPRRAPTAPPAGGPPADWLERVRRGAPHLLEPGEPQRVPMEHVSPPRRGGPSQSRFHDSVSRARADETPKVPAMDWTRLSTTPSVNPHFTKAPAQPGMLRFSRAQSALPTKELSDVPGHAREKPRAPSTHYWLRPDPTSLAPSAPPAGMIDRSSQDASAPPPLRSPTREQSSLRGTAGISLRWGEGALRTLIDPANADVDPRREVDTGPGVREARGVAAFSLGLHVSGFTSPWESRPDHQERDGRNLEPRWDSGDSSPAFWAPRDTPMDPGAEPSRLGHAPPNVVWPAQADASYWPTLPDTDRPSGATLTDPGATRRQERLRREQRGEVWSA